MIKRMLIILACWAGTLSLFAQAAPDSTRSSRSHEIHTLFDKGFGHTKIPLGYFFEMDGSYTHFGHKSVFLPGMSMGVILDHHWTIGLAGNMIASPPSGSYHHHNSQSDTIHEGKHENSRTGGYGGLLLEYTLFPQSKVHVSFPLIIGVGYIGHSHEYHDAGMNTDTTHHEGFLHGKSFFVLEPGVKLEVNVIRHLRIGLGISYRYTPEKNHWVTSPDALNQLTGKLSIRLGKF